MKKTPCIFIEISISCFSHHLWADRDRDCGSAGVTTYFVLSAKSIVPVSAYQLSWKPDCVNIFGWPKVTINDFGLK